MMTKEHYNQSVSLANKHVLAKRRYLYNGVQEGVQERSLIDRKLCLAIIEWVSAQTLDIKPLG